MPDENAARLLARELILKSHRAAPHHSQQDFSKLNAILLYRRLKGRSDLAERWPE